MRYVMLIYGNESAWANLTPEQIEEEMKGHGAFYTEASARGMAQGGEELQPSSVATCLRVRNGHMLKTDGPFIETKEQLGGFYILDCKDLDEALEMAAKIPTAKQGVIEIRPVVERGG